MRSVVVVEDETDQLTMTVMLLRASGHRVVGTTDGERAVDLVRRDRPDVLVLDFVLPGMTGGDVGHAIAADPSLRRPVIVFLSGTPEAEIRRLGATYDFYLSKPAHPQALLDIIASS